MSLGSITVDSLTYNETADGVYRLSTLNFGDPDNSIVIRPNVNPKADPARFSVSHVRQVDVVVNGKTERKTMTHTQSYVIPLAGFTSLVADESSSRIAAFLTPVIINGILQGRA